MSTNNERMNILELIDKGEIGAEEGAKRLDQLNVSSTPEADKEPLDDRMTILEKIETGQLTSEEGAERLKQAQPKAVDHVIIQADSHARQAEPPEDLKRWRQWWLIPLWVGIGVTVISGLLMNSIYNASGTGFWFFCSIIPLMLGALLIWAGSLSSSARWLHVRVKQPGHSKPNIAISIPIPFRFAAWLLRTFGQWIPGLDETVIDEVIIALDKDTYDNPLHVHVSDGADGEQFDIFIG